MANNVRLASDGVEVDCAKCRGPLKVTPSFIACTRNEPTMLSAVFPSLYSITLVRLKNEAHNPRGAWPRLLISLKSVWKYSFLGETLRDHLRGVPTLRPAIGEQDR